MSDNKPKPCPTCGTCPTCGHKPPVVVLPPVVVRPYPTYPSPYWYGGQVYSGSHTVSNAGSFTINSGGASGTVTN